MCTNFKAIFVPLGFQIFGLDHSGTFDKVLIITSMSSLLGSVPYFDVKVHHVDVLTTF